MESIIYFLLLFAFSFFINRYYSKKIGINKLKKFIKSKEKEFNDKISAKVLNLDDINSVISVDLKKFHQLEVEIEKKLYSLDSKLNQINENSKNLQKKSKEFDQYEDNLKNSLSDIKEQLKKIKEKEITSKKIDEEITSSSKKIKPLKQVIEKLILNLQEKLEKTKEETNQKMRNTIQDLKTEIKDKKNIFENEFSQKVDEIIQLNEKLKNDMEHKQTEFINQNQKKLHALFTNNINNIDKEELENLKDQLELSQEEIKNIQQNTQLYQSQFSQQVKNLILKYDQIKNNSSTKESQKQLETVSQELLTLKAEFNQSKKLKKSKQSQFEKFSEYINEHQFTINDKVSLFETHLSKLKNKLEKIESNDISLVLKKGSKLKKNIKDFFKKEENLIEKEIKNFKEKLEKDLYQNIMSQSIQIRDKVKKDIRKNITSIKLSEKDLATILQQAKKNQEKIKKEANNHLEKIKKDFSEISKNWYSKLEREQEVFSNEIKKSIQLEINKEDNLANKQLEKIASSLNKQKQNIIDNIQETLDDYLLQEKENIKLTINEVESETQTFFGNTKEEFEVIKSQFSDMNNIKKSLEIKLEEVENKVLDFEKIKEEINENFSKEIKKKKSNFFTLLQDEIDLLNKQKEEKSNIYYQNHQELDNQLAFLENDKKKFFSKIDTILKEAEQQKTTANKQISNIIKDFQKELSKQAEIKNKDQFESLKNDLQLKMDKEINLVFQKTNKTQDELNSLKEKFQTQMSNEIKEVFKQKSTLKDLMGKIEDYDISSKEKLDKLILDNEKTLKEFKSSAHQELNAFSKDEKKKTQDEMNKQSLYFQDKLKNTQKELSNIKEKFQTQMSNEIKEVFKQKSTLKDLMGKIEDYDISSKEKLDKLILGNEKTLKELKSSAHQELNAFSKDEKKKTQDEMNKQSLYFQDKLKNTQKELSNIKEKFQTQMSNEIKEVFKQKSTLKDLMGKIEDYDISSKEKLDKLILDNEKTLKELKSSAHQELNAFSKDEKKKTQDEMNKQSLYFQDKLKNTQKELSNIKEKFQTQMSNEIKNFTKQASTLKNLMNKIEGYDISSKEKLDKLILNNEKTLKELKSSAHQELYDFSKDEKKKVQKEMEKLFSTFEKKTIQTQKDLINLKGKFQTQMSNEVNDINKQKEEKSNIYYQNHQELDNQLAFLEKKKKKFFSKIDTILKEAEQQKTTANKQISNIIKDFQKELSKQAEIKNKDQFESLKNDLQLKMDKEINLVFQKTNKTQDELNSLKEKFQTQMSNEIKEVSKQKSILKDLMGKIEDYDISSKEKLDKLILDNEKTLKELKSSTHQELNAFSKDEKKKTQDEMNKQSLYFQDKLKNTQKELSNIKEKFQNDVLFEIKEFKDYVKNEIQNSNQLIKSLSPKKDKRFIDFEIKLNKELEQYQKSFQNLIEQQQQAEIEINEINEKKLIKAIEDIENLNTEHKDNLNEEKEKLKEMKNNFEQEEKERKEKIKNFIKTSKKIIDSLDQQIDLFKEQHQNKASKLTEKFDSLHKDYQKALTNQEVEFQKNIEEVSQKIENTLTSKKQKIEEDFTKISQNLKEKEKLLSLESNKQFEGINKKIIAIAEQIDNFTKQTNIFKKTDILKEKLDQSIKHYNEKIESMKEKSSSLSDVDKQLKLATLSQKQIEKIFNKISLKEGDILMVNQKIENLKSFSETVDTKINSIEKSKKQIIVFLNQINSIRQDSNTIKEDFIKIKDSKIEVDSTIKEYKHIIEENQEIQEQHFDIKRDSDKLKENQADIKNQLDKIENKSMILEGNQKKLIEFNEKYDQLDIALQDIEQRKRIIDKMKDDLLGMKTTLISEKEETKKIKNTLDEQIKMSLKLLNKERQKNIIGDRDDEEKNMTESTKESVLSLSRIGWSKEEISKHLSLEIYEVELILQENQ